MDCVFCGIANKQIPAFIVYEEEGFIAFLDINPANPGHIIVAPKKHYKNVMEMPEAAYTRMHAIARALALALFKFGAEGVDILLPIGSMAGQRIQHAFLHVIPRFPKDKVNFTWEPLKLTEEQFKEILRRIRAEIGVAEEKEEEKVVYEERLP